jgi:hypothetical protein
MADCRYNSSVIGGENCSVKLSERQQDEWVRKHADIYAEALLASCDRVSYEQSQ